MRTCAVCAVTSVSRLGRSRTVRPSTGGALKPDRNPKPNRKPNRNRNPNRNRDPDPGPNHNPHPNPNPGEALDGGALVRLRLLSWFDVEGDLLSTQLMEAANLSGAGVSWLAPNRRPAGGEGHRLELIQPLLSRLDEPRLRWAEVRQLTAGAMLTLTATQPRPRDRPLRASLPP